jgi:hypothetical protein
MIVFAERQKQVRDILSFSPAKFDGVEVRFADFEFGSNVLNYLLGLEV